MNIRKNLFLLALLLVTTMSKAQQSKSAFQQLTGRAVGAYVMPFDGASAFGLTLQPSGGGRRQSKLFAKRVANSQAGLQPKAPRKKESFNQFKVSKELPKPSLGVHFSPFYSLTRNPFNRDDKWTGVGGKLNVDYEFFLSRRLSIVAGVNYGRKWFDPYEGYDDKYQSHEYGGYVFSRFRFTNPERKLVFFAEAGFTASYEDFKGIDSDLIGDDDRFNLNFELGFGAEYKLSDKVSLNAVIGPSWAGSSGFQLNARLGARFRF